jgi:hypothetical protein
MSDFYDDIFNDIFLIDDESDCNGVIFQFKSKFKIIDKSNGYFIHFHTLYKRSYKGYENEIKILLNNNPFYINDIHNIELDDFKINKIYIGEFIINVCENKNIEIFLKNLIK